MAGLGKSVLLPLDLTLTYSKNLSSVFDETFGGLGYAAEAGLVPSLSGEALPMNIQSALNMINVEQHPGLLYETGPLASTPQRWLSQPPNLELYDSEVINIFLNLAVNHLGPTFTFLETFATDTTTRPELYLAVAAIGGLFCQVLGSYKIAEAMFHDSRRLLHEIVRSPHPHKRSTKC